MKWQNWTAEELSPLLSGLSGSCANSVKQVAKIPFEPPLACLFLPGKDAIFYLLKHCTGCLRMRLLKPLSFPPQLLTFKRFRPFFEEKRARLIKDVSAELLKVREDATRQLILSLPLRKSGNM